MSRMLAAEAVALESAARQAGTPGRPDGPLLIEAANQWRLAGDTERCRTLLHTVISYGGEAACFARAELVASLLDDTTPGAVDAARAELDRLAADPSITEDACQLVAELLTDHGSLRRALDWYERAIARWSPDRRAAARDQHGRPSPDQLLMQQRNRIRRRLGYAV
jgi:hypothetical protein